MPTTRFFYRLCQQHVFLLGFSEQPVVFLGSISLSLFLKKNTHISYFHVYFFLYCAHLLSFRGVPRFVIFVCVCVFVCVCACVCVCGVPKFYVFFVLFSVNFQKAPPTKTWFPSAFRRPHTHKKTYFPSTLRRPRKEKK